MSEASDQDLIKFLPKVEVTQFIEQNKKDFSDLKDGTAEVKQKMDGLDSITD